MIRPRTLPPEAESTHDLPRLPEAPPYVWPVSSHDVEQSEGASATPLLAHVVSARAVFGVMVDVDAQAVELLLECLESSESFGASLIIAVYPTCATTEEDLALMQTIEDRFGERIRFRILPVPSVASIPNAVCVHGAEEAVLLSVGATANLGLSSYGWPSLDLGIAADPLVQSAFQRWFESVWAAAALLDDQTMRIPALVPARGSPEAADLWRQFKEACASSVMQGQAEKASSATSDENSPNPTDSPPASASPLASLGIPRIDETAQEVIRLFKMGQQATIYRGSGVPPLDAPMRPEWFGIDGQRQVGAASREIKYRISVLDANTLKELDKRRKRPAEILRRLSYPLSDSVYWVPHKAKALIERELTRANDESRKILDGVLPDGAQKFIKGRQGMIARDANAMYHEFHPGRQLAPDVLETIFTTLAERLGKALSGRFLPQISYADVQPRLAHRSDWESGWGQALTLLQAVAEMPRQVLTEPRFLWGLKIEEDEWLNAMNVADDTLLSGKRPDRRRAEDELRWLGEIRSAEADSRARCKAILSLLDGNGERAVQELCCEADNECVRNVGASQ